MGITAQRSGISKRLDDFKNLIVGLIISLFRYSFDPYNNKCESLSLGKLLILGSTL